MVFGEDQSIIWNSHIQSVAGARKYLLCQDFIRDLAVFLGSGRINRRIHLWIWKVGAGAAHSGDHVMDSSSKYAHVK